MTKVVSPDEVVFGDSTARPDVLTQPQEGATEMNPLENADIIGQYLRGILPFRSTRNITDNSLRSIPADVSWLTPYLAFNAEFRLVGRPTIPRRIIFDQWGKEDDHLAYLLEHTDVMKDVPEEYPFIYAPIQNLAQRVRKYLGVTPVLNIAEIKDNITKLTGVISIESRSFLALILKHGAQYKQFCDAIKVKDTQSPPFICLYPAPTSSDSNHENMERNMGEPFSIEEWRKAVEITHDGNISALVDDWRDLEGKILFAKESSEPQKLRKELYDRLKLYAPGLVI